MKSGQTVGISGLIAAVLFAGVPLCAAPYSEFPRFKVIEGQLNADGLPISGATLCVSGKQQTCYQMPSETYSDSGSVTYEFGLYPHAERLALAGGGSWVFFSAIFSGGGSGTLTRFAILRYSDDAKGAKIVNLLPWVGATNVSDWATWTVKGASEFPILVRADFVWGDGETHFGSHIYKIEVWKFDPRKDLFQKAFEYKTSKKYPGGDDSAVRVLGPERGEILKRLRTK